ncbi:hypothetical protein [Stenotrophomonas sp. NA06056]|uniref:hypothetical protein n=1 Tax=Stenotrophomonas sp. NA06056 TaxID=2742129 RepID=UPI00158A543F|nr:hypothetical protein [Stenotrophomonas sp. NA06056]QKW56188.1 hypothetical protein HUT07_05990 [Stenotrophomonas sp. NA06056]
MTQDHVLGWVDRQAAGPAPRMSGRASGLLPRVARRWRVHSALKKVLGASGLRRVDARARPWLDELEQGSTRVRMEVE